MRGELNGVVSPLSWTSECSDGKSLDTSGRFRPASESSFSCDMAGRRGVEEPAKGSGVQTRKVVWAEGSKLSARSSDNKRVSPRDRQGHRRRERAQTTHLGDPVVCVGIERLLGEGAAGGARAGRVVRAC